MIKKINNKFEAGFSLVEIIVSISVILVIFSLLILEIDALSISKKQRYEYIASQIANNQIETLRATSYDSLPSSGTISDSQLSQLPSGAGSFTVSDYPDYTNLKQLSVTVTWNDGASKSFVITSLVGGQGINQ